MEVTSFVELISTVGFPIACVIALGAFVFYVYKKQTEENATNMANVQERCKTREEKLYEEITKNREINAKAIETISLYAERLEVIQHDVNEIKTDIAVLAKK